MKVKLNARTFWWFIAFLCFTFNIGTGDNKAAYPYTILAQQNEPFQYGVPHIEVTCLSSTCMIIRNAFLDS